MEIKEPEEQVFVTSNFEHPCKADCGSDSCDCGEWPENCLTCSYCYDGYNDDDGDDGGW